MVSYCFRNGDISIWNVKLVCVCVDIFIVFIFWLASWIYIGNFQILYTSIYFESFIVLLLLVNFTNLFRLKAEIIYDKTPNKFKTEVSSVNLHAAFRYPLIQSYCARMRKYSAALKIAEAFFFVHQQVDYNKISFKIFIHCIRLCKPTHIGFKSKFIIYS